MNGFNLKKINLTAIQNISVEEIRAFTSGYKYESWTALAIAAGCLAGFFLFQDQSARIAELKDRYTSLSEKTEPAAALKKMLGEKQAFTRTLPQAVTENSFMGFLSDFATEHGLQIVSFQPPLVTSFPFLRKVSVKLDLSAPNFRAAMSFLAGLEHTDYSLRVDSWSMNPVIDASAVQGVLKLNVLVSSFEVLDNEAKDHEDQ